jgi:glycosyltransferase involved in cell wall biosynthesis
MVPCTSTVIGPPYVNVIGGVADKTLFVEALDRVYRSAELRDELRQSGLVRVQEPRFRWPNIGQRYVEALDSLFASTEEVWQDIGRPEEVTALESPGV